MSKPDRTYTDPVLQATDTLVKEESRKSGFTLNPMAMSLLKDFDVKVSIHALFDWDVEVL